MVSNLSDAINEVETNEKKRPKKNNNKIHLINGGNSLRDFINLKDIARIYKLFLEKDYKSGIYDLGTGKGYFIKDIVSYLKLIIDHI